MNFNMLKQAQELKSKLDKAQKELKNLVVEGEAGKGAVKVTINGQQKILSIKIDTEVINPNKAKDLEKLILKAIEEASDKSQKMAARQLKDLTGGLKIPGLT
ncbi:MAG: nucleoid-associated protein, YbaB/EbfC family [Chloroflexi bacterium RBG_16_51_9]|nr:MAG: nucleoid-associated protein, YbaB/EbfC family [Chloroflexi bacterium RBG_16_51_9]